MSNVKHEIAVQVRSEFGRNAARRARHIGLIPVNVYAKGKENRAFFVKANEWEILRKQDFSLVYLINGGERIGAVVQEMQINYLKNYVVHVDFHEVELNKDTHASVKVVSVGEAQLGITGVLEQQLHEIEVIGKPQAIPDVIEVNVSGLGLEESITVKDIELPVGVTAKTDADAVVFHVGLVAREEASPDASASKTE